MEFSSFTDFEESFPRDRDGEMFPYRLNEFQLVPSSDFSGKCPFELFNGKAIPYRLCWDKELKWTAGPNARLWRLHTEKKIHWRSHLTRLTFNADEWCRYVVCVADFDIKPQAVGLQNWMDYHGQRRYDEQNEQGWGVPGYPIYSKAQHSWQALRDFLQERLGNKAYVICSHKSGRVKIFFLMDYGDNKVRKPLREHAVEVIRHHLGNLAKGFVFDTTISGLYTADLGLHQRDEAMFAFRKLQPTKIAHNGITALVVENPEEFESLANHAKAVESKFKYCVPNELHPELEYATGEGRYRDFLKTLTAMNGLILKEGFQISQNSLARTLDVTQPMISEYLRKACSQGLLKLKSRKYWVGVMAMTYVATGKLKKLLKLKRATHEPKLPTEIADGQWHEVLLRTIAKSRKLWNDPELFLAWVKTVPGWLAKNRWAKAREIAKWAIKKGPRPG